MAKKISNTNICMSCLGDFTDKEVYWVKRNDFYQVLHCFNCLEEKGITEYIPYLKPRKKREKIEKTEITVEKKTIKKKTKS